jgi:hypothetical protein
LSQLHARCACAFGRQHHAGCRRKKGELRWEENVFEGKSLKVNSLLLKISLQCFSAPCRCKVALNDVFLSERLQDSCSFFGKVDGCDVCPAGSGDRFGNDGNLNVKEKKKI